MEIKLRPYQEKDFHSIRSLIRQGHKSILYQLPCGGGKTILMSRMAQGAAAKNNPTIFTVHRRELIQQSSRILERYNIPHGIIAPGYSMTADPIQIASIQTARNRIDRIIKPRLLILDECHHSKAKTWEKLIEAFPDAIKIGLSATPCRLSGESLGDIFKILYQGPSMRELIDQGYLTDYDIYIPPSDLDLSQCKIQYGDYAKADIEKATNKAVITGNAVKHYLRLAQGRSCIVFCITINHSKNVAAEFKKYGLAAAHVDSKMNKYQRGTIIDNFRAGKIKILTNVDLISEGFDLDCVDCISMLRPTMSLSLFIQQTGRALRPSDQRAVIIDHVNNTNNFGFPDDDREWDLKGNYVHKRDKKYIERVRQCMKCYYVYPTRYDVCPECKTPWIPNKEQIKYIEAELQKAERDRDEKLLQQQRKRQAYEETKDFETLEDWQNYAREKGYKIGWAFYRWKARQEKELANAKH